VWLKRFSASRQNPSSSHRKVRIAASAVPFPGLRRKPAILARGEEARLGWLLSIPLLIVMVVLVYYPLLLGLMMSLRSIIFSLGIPQRFVGLQNYVDVLKSPDTHAAMIHTVAFVLVAVSIEFVWGLAIALALNRPFRGRGLIFAILILPWALPAVVNGVLWSRVFNPDNGLLNVLLIHLGIIHAPQVWLASPVWSIVLIGVVHAWGIVPLTTLIILAGLQSIPNEIYTASAVDGATGLRQFQHITLPLLRPALAVALTTGTVIALAIFDEIYVLNGTALATRSLMMQVYLTTFQDLDFGHGAALAFVLTAVTGIVALQYLVALRRVSQ
jgi:multiple sugar transport system permease protein